MVEIIYDHITQNGTKNIVEYWCDSNSLTRFNFIKSKADCTNVIMRHLSLINYLKKYAFRG